MRLVGFVEVERQEVRRASRIGQDGDAGVSQLVAYRGDGSVAAACHHEIVFGGIFQQRGELGSRAQRADGNGIALFGIAAHEVVHCAVA